MLLPDYLAKHHLAAWTALLADDHDASAGWGRKKSFFKAQAWAKQHGTALLCLEDGFIRSMGLGKQGFAPLSIVADRQGIYFDATVSSDLEQLIQQPEQVAQNLRAEKAIAKILAHGLTKYNQKFAAIDRSVFSPSARHILVVDQTFADQSIRYAGATENTFQAMLRQACQDHPDAHIWIKTHPDVIAGRAKAHLSQADLTEPRIQFLAQQCNPLELLQEMDEVYVVSSQLGFEALLCGKPVHCFGVPWYSAWGLTHDQHAPVHILAGRRQQPRSLAHLFYCAYVEYAHYLSPVDAQRCSLEDILDIFATNVDFQKKHPVTIYAHGFSLRKQQFLKDYFNFPQNKLKFAWQISNKKSQPLLAWGKKAHAFKEQGYQRVITAEDGFVRSVGLGAQLVRPNSLVFDEVGIYYDASRKSGIENLLNQIELSPEQQQRAEKLQQLLIELNISKYNVGSRHKLSRPVAQQRVILVIGQVEDDLSVQKGSAQIKTNLDLLKTVRQQHPDAYLIYKPHPDVQTGLRIGKISAEDVAHYANEMQEQASIVECFEICDEVHTMTSLSGFEALLRGLSVYCYGLPFYAGWGLTHDLYTCERRQRVVNLQTLIYVTLVQYPVYNLPQTAIHGIALVRPEDVIASIQQIRMHGARRTTGYKKLLSPLYKFLKKLG